MLQPLIRKTFLLMSLVEFLLFFVIYFEQKCRNFDPKAVFQRFMEREKRGKREKQKPWISQRTLNLVELKSSARESNDRDGGRDTREIERPRDNTDRVMQQSKQR